MKGLVFYYNNYNIHRYKYCPITPKNQNHNEMKEGGVDWFEYFAYNKPWSRKPVDEKMCIQEISQENQFVKTCICDLPVPKDLQSPRDSHTHLRNPPTPVHHLLQTQAMIISCDFE